MDALKAVLIAEDPNYAESEEQYLEAWQYLVNTGLAWQLQGWFGRTAQAYIDNGYIQPAGVCHAE
jgi:hypothetical protein